MWFLRLTTRWLTRHRQPAEVTDSAPLRDPWAEQAIRDFEEEMKR